MQNAAPPHVVIGDLAAGVAEGTIRVVDLTARLSASTPVLPLPEPMAPIPPFRLIELARFDERGETSYQNEIRTGEHVGTHFDAPCHWITGQEHGDVADVPVERMIASAVVLDRSDEVEQDPDFLLEVDDLLAWQESNGPLPKGGWLLYRTGWASRSNDQVAFLNADQDGPHTPGISAECARWLAEDCELIGVGVETVGTDAGQAFRFEPAFPVHTYLLGAGRYGLTQLQNLSELPTRGAVLVVTPLPIVGGSGSPARVLALISGDKAVS
jgi:kynurenine formamidase